MQAFIANVSAELENLGKTPQGDHLKTGDIRRLSAKLFRGLPDKSTDHVFALCGGLLEQRNWPMGVIAFDFAYRVKAEYDENTFALFESWLANYVRGWGDCDDLCTHAFGTLICQRTALVTRVIPWTKREEFWMRRAAAVVLLPSIWRGQYKKTIPLAISDLLMADDHDLVRKGYGWMLKELSAKEPEMVFDYLLKNKAVMPRTVYRYALQRFDADKRELLMR